MKRDTPVNANPLCTPRKSHPWRRTAACDNVKVLPSFAVEKRNAKEKRK